MANIPLRDYCREIENMIDKGRTEEAIGHCRHILKHFPKHIETYQLLGKAYLESRQLGDAADVFQRVLSSIPEDFVSHIGMSIIREDEGNLDAAIWHMERAYEVQPSNLAIQDELKRLYTGRDGQEPSKIRLTRGALAHMYANGHLYSQAIAELRTALSTDPKRLDLQSLLAQMYYEDRQPANAAKIASQLLKKLPYSLAANQILAKILAKTQRANEAESHRNRIQELDPYSKHISSQYPSTEAVPPGLIVIEFLDWDATKGGIISQPAWATSIGVDISNTSASEELPEWLSPVSTEGSLEPSSDFGEISVDDQFSAFADPMAESASDWGGNLSIKDETEKQSYETNQNEAKTMQNEDDNIPDWMKEAGWGQRDPNTPEEPPTPLFDDDDEEEEEAPVGQGEIAKADIPDWLKAMAPGDMPAEDDSEIEASADLPDWLQGFNTAETAPTRISPEAEDAPPSWMTANDETSDDTALEAPDWLQEETAMDAPQSTSGPSTLEKADMPDWLKDMDPDSSAESSGFDLDDMGESTAPDWLQDFGDEVASSTLPTSEAEMPDLLSEDDDIPSTAGSDLDVLSGEPEKEAAPSGLSWLDDATADEVDDPSFHSGVTDWLTEINSSSDETEPEALPASDVPDWLQGLGEDLPEPVDSIEQEPAGKMDEGLAPSFDMSDLGKDATQISEGQELSAEDDAMAWLESLAAKQGAKEEELLTNVESRQESSLPTWLDEMTDEPAAELEEAGNEDEDMVPDWLKETEEDAEPAASMFEDEGELVGAANQDMVPDWLKGMEDELEPAGSLFDDEEPIAEFEVASEAGEDMVPDWLNDVNEEAEPPEAEIEGVDETMAEDLDVPEMVEPTGEGQMPEMEDEDAAMAWLEALAAKQGAKEEELLTAPTERSDDVPDWLKGVLDEDDSSTDLEEELVPEEDAVHESEPSPEPAMEVDFDEEEDLFQESEIALDTEVASTLEEVEQPIAETDSVTEGEGEMLDEDAALAWLESLAMKHGVNEDELLTDAEKRPEETPDWVTSVAEDALAEEQAAAQLETPDEIESILEEESEYIEEEVAQEEGDTSWLSELLEDEDVPAPIEEFINEEPVAEETAPNEEAEIPEWLMDDEAQADEEPEVPGWVLEEPILEEPKVPDWVFEESEGEPAAEEKDVPAWILEETQEEEEEVSSTSFETESADEVEAVPVMEAQSETEPESVIEVPVLADASETLSQARSSLSNGDINTAADYYSSLIKSNQNVDEAIADITEALNTRYPVDIDLWLLLGDGNVKKNNLQEALDAYTKAEELLR